MSEDKEEEKPEEKKSEEPTPDNSGEGVQSETISELDRADQIAERQARENTRREGILDREEALAARKAVGGVAEAGQTIEKKEETNADYAKKVMANDL